MNLFNHEYIFFWGGIYSNWYESPIKIDGINYNCVEQYMMYKKAELFNDNENMRNIMETSSPARQKKIGRLVKGFCMKEWRKVCFDIVKTGCIAKFTQNEELKKELLSTEDKIIVEASPYDKIWGIGMSENDPDRFDQSKWKGENLLGKCIMAARKEIRDAQRV